MIQISDRDTSCIPSITKLQLEKFLSNKNTNTEGYFKLVWLMSKYPHKVLPVHMQWIGDRLWVSFMSLTHNDLGRDNRFILEWTPPYGNQKGLLYAMPFDEFKTFASYYNLHTGNDAGFALWGKINYAPTAEYTIVFTRADPENPGFSFMSKLCLPASEIFDFNTAVEFESIKSEQDLVQLGYNKQCLKDANFRDLKLQGWLPAVLNHNTFQSSPVNNFKSENASMPRSDNLPPSVISTVFSKE